VGRSKLDNVSQKGIFIGYEPGSKAYRVWLDDNKKIIITRNVTFNEGFFSSSKPSESSGSGDKDDEQQDSGTDDEDDGDDAASGAPAAGQQHRQRPPGAEAAPSRQQAQDMEQDDSDSEGASAVRRSKRANLGRPDQEWYKASVATADDSDEPQTIEQALQSPNADKWRQAMDEEMASLHANNTWTLDRVPPGIKPIPVK
jgi:hypothetical protein